MDLFRNKIQRFQFVSGLIMTALVIQLIFPVHVHMHHDNSSVEGNSHIIDFHLQGDNQLYEHATEEGVHELDTSPYAIIKKVVNTDLLVFLAAALIIFMAIRLPAVNRYWLLARHTLNCIYHTYFRPLLRAPPPH